MRPLNVIIRQNWIGVIILVALIVFAIIKLSPENEKSSNEYTRVETSEVQTNEVKLVQAPSNDVVRAATEQNISTNNSVDNNTGDYKEYRFVFRLDGSEGHHIPHLLGMGVLNKQGTGYDFLTKPNTTSDDDYGRLENGIYFIKETLIIKAGMTSFCELKSNEFGWIPKKMVLAEIDGERAYIYQP
ncbi:MAG: hypothetical protein PF488_00105 [Patescibacteria group bacterium]|jgi:hypothetical protein|nr:hypothetical protein [Patescibacteria group bacterium]